MLKGKRKYIVIGLIAVVVLAGSIVGVAYAQTGATTPSGNTTLLDRVAGILKIDPQTLKNAFTQAQKEQRAERESAYLDKLVKDGKITQAQADQYKQWLQSRPDIQLPGQNFRGFNGRGGMMGGYNFRGAPNSPKPSTTPQ